MADETDKKTAVEPVTLYDSDGNAVQAMSMDKVNSITGEIDTLKKELDGYKSKDYNFAQFRHKSDEEKKEILNEMSAKERLLYEKIDNLEQEKVTENASNIDKAHKAALQELAGNDEELKKSIELQEKDLFGQAEAKTPEEKIERLRKAEAIIKYYKPKANPLHSPLNATYREPDTEKKRPTDTPEGRAKYARAFPDSPTVAKWRKDGLVV